MVSNQEITEMIQRIKQEPQEEDLGYSSKYFNGGTSRRFKRKPADEMVSTSEKRFRHFPENGKPSIPCLMCDRYLENQDELMIHMALDHKGVPQGNRRQVGRIPKHTCQICFAKFRTLRDLFTHTALHAKQMQLNREWVSNIGNRLEKTVTKQGARRQYFQNNLHGEIQHGSFRCDCCNTVFMNRDTYAMHVMMRVKDEMCKQDDVSNKLNIKDSQSEYGNTIELVPPQNKQDYLIDVTSSVIEDEYLKTALTVADSHQKIAREQLPKLNNRIQVRKCMYCSEHFHDQDAMAMHVMSVHSGIAQKQTSLKTDTTVQSKKKIPDPRPVVNVREYFCCHCCGKIVESREYLTIHLLTHHADNNGSAGLTKNDTDTSGTTHKHETKVPKANTQDEPLNLVSEKNPKESVKTTDHIQNNKTNDEAKWTKWPEKVQQPICNINKRKTTERRSRSVSLSDIRKNSIVFITRSRPASTGGIKATDPCPDNQSVINLDDSRNSPESYSYEQPETYVEDREHSCQYINSQHNDPLELLLQKRDHAHVCSYCEIIFLNRTLYYLHMGLHNVNNPLQCNMCGKTCDNIHDFSAHVIHL